MTYIVLVLRTQQHDHFNKEVILLPNQSWGVVCKQGPKSWLHKHGHTVLERIRDGFGEHIPDDVSSKRGLVLHCWQSHCSEIGTWRSTTKPPLADIADTELLEKVKKVSESTTLEDLEKSNAPLLDYLANAGCLRPMRSIRDRDLLVQDIVIFQVIHRVQGPFQRYSVLVVVQSDQSQKE
ncbi:uncharacterized protein LOC116052868 isoform X4 [Sander lucioperca]|uniref:uncharacterized protein LOC116052868 isoform X4 n=1 Tax=Sander lucioperca TaxID=283035 RepID=UPI00125D77F4|nr:uncharacterized protein LOC116052868 isoform X4 [Sander lucioperca]